MLHKNIKQDKQYCKGYEAKGMKRVAITVLCRVVREITSVKVTLEKELKELRKQIKQRHLGEEYSTQREQQEQMS